MSELRHPMPTGRHRRNLDARPRWVRRAGAATAAVLVVAGAGVAMGSARQDAGSCPGGVRRLQVTVAPEIAGILTEAARVADADQAATCRHTQVRSRSAAAVAESVRVTSSPSSASVGQIPAPDVWIPDSSLWLRTAVVGALALPVSRPSVARSPVVMALTASSAARLGWDSRPVDLSRLLDGTDAGGASGIRLPDPHGSAVSAAGLLSLQTSVARRPQDRAAFTATLLGHATSRTWTQSSDPIQPLVAEGATATPASEQAVWAHNRSAAAAHQVVAVYPAVAAGSLDYPFTVLTRDRRAQVDAARLMAMLRSHVGQDLLRANGFRVADGAGGSVLTARFGVNGTVSAGPAPRADDVDGALRAADAVMLGSRMLAVIDVSGSMGERVPGAGPATRLDLTKSAAGRGLGLYPDDTRIGLWAFSTHLTETTDYREIVPVGPLSARPGGPSGRAQLARALASLQHVPGGSTGLYDTALAATRRVRAGWEAGRVNSVVLLSDGKNEDDHGIDLAQLLRSLRAESDPARPVPLITIAYGSQSPVAALRAMSAATAGATYVAKDPRQVRQVFLEAIGQRSCRPTCAQDGP